LSSPSPLHAVLEASWSLSLLHAVLEVLWSPSLLHAAAGAIVDMVWRLETGSDGGVMCWHWGAASLVTLVLVVVTVGIARNGGASGGVTAHW